jgi:hypothetical protein
MNVGKLLCSEIAAGSCKLQTIGRQASEWQKCASMPSLLLFKVEPWAMTVRLLDANAEGSDALSIFVYRE